MFCLLVGFLGEFRHKFYTQKEDPGIIIQVAVLIQDSLTRPRCIGVSSSRNIHFTYKIFGCSIILGYHFRPKSWDMKG